MQRIFLLTIVSALIGSGAIAQTNSNNSSAPVPVIPSVAPSKMTDKATQSPADKVSETVNKESKDSVNAGSAQSHQ